MGSKIEGLELAATLCDRKAIEYDERARKEGKRGMSLATIKSKAHAARQCSKIIRQAIEKERQSIRTVIDFYNAMEAK